MMNNNKTELSKEIDYSTLKSISTLSAQNGV